MTVIVCNACGEPWDGHGNPAVCPKCGVASFGIAVERNGSAQLDGKDKGETQPESATPVSSEEGGAKMTIEGTLREFVSDFAMKEDWIRLDALNQWATGIPAPDITDNLRARYPEVKAFPARYDKLAEDLKAQLKEIGVEYPSYQPEGMSESVGSFIQREIDSQCGDYFREDIRKRIGQASDGERNLLYLYAKYPRTSQDRDITSTGLPPDAWKGLFEATFGPVLSGNAVDILRWFNVCNHYFSSGRRSAFWHYLIPRYAAPIIDNIEEYAEVPQIADAEAYVQALASSGNIPRLAFLEIALGHSKDTSWTSTWEIKNSFELLFPAMFDKYSQSMVGILANIENTLYFCPFNKDRLLRALLNAKRDMAVPLLTIFNKLKDATGKDGDIDFQDNLGAYGGYINLGGRVTLFTLLTPWIIPSQQRGFKDYLQQLPWVYERTPCLILTTDSLRPDLSRAIQNDGLRDICMASLDEKMNTINIYVFGASTKAFDNLAETLRGLGYQVVDQTKSLREEWYPLNVDAVANFAYLKFSWRELQHLPGRTKDDKIRGEIEKYGLEEYAKRIGYPSLTYGESGGPDSTGMEKGKPAVGREPEAEIKEEQPVSPALSKSQLPIKPTLESKGIVVGAKDATKQWGIIGRCKDSPVKLDLNAPHIITVFGKMGSGKGYTIGVICEMLCSPSIPNISEVGKRATILVLYKPKEDVPSEFWSVTSPNDVQEEIEGLAVYGTKPAQVIPPENLRIFLDPQVYKKAADKFTKEYKTNNVYPLYMDPSSLRGDEWALVLSAGGSGEPLYVKRLFKIIENLQFETFAMATLRQSVWLDSDLTQAQKKLANQRMDILATYLEPEDGSQEFTKLLAIGGVNIFDLRGTIRTPDDDFSVMTLILSLLQSKKGFEGEPFAFVINEAHTYFRKGISQEFVEAVENLIRRKRHGANWLFLDSHDPGDLDEKVIELSDIKVLHFTDKTALKSATLTKAFESSPKNFYELATGEALISADYSSVGSFVPLLVSIRPRLTKHGAPTKMAID